MIRRRMEDSESNRLIIVSNRLPVVLKKDAEGRWHMESGSGGLVTALAPVLKNRGGLWIGWPGISGEDITEIESVLRSGVSGTGFSYVPVELTEEEEDKFYRGFANEIIWPLFHDFPSYCIFDPDYWATYKAVNHKFAEVIASNITRDDFIWVHDYHLICAARELRRMTVRSKIAFFLHIPFPPLDIFVRLPWRFQILYSLLEFDLIGFQTMRDRRNFIHCVRTLLKDVAVIGKGQVVTALQGDREVRIGTFPISIDFREFARNASTQEVAERAWYIHEDFPDKKIILGIDRLDYTKGIPERLRAFRRLLERFPDLHEKVTLMQVVVPSRRHIPRYAELKIEIEGLVGEINGQFTTSGWIPIQYIFRSLDKIELLAYYRTAEIALITPLKDGMNLVAKEFCACDIEEKGILILSEFAGTISQLHTGALIVNPHDIDGVADAIHYGLHMDYEESQARMKKMRRSVRKYDIFWWVDSFLRAAIAKDLKSFPVLEYYIPEEVHET
jgi:trehalose 6-phosphate synthase/phosphatase